MPRKTKSFHATVTAEVCISNVRRIGQLSDDTHDIYDSDVFVRIDGDGLVRGGMYLTDYMFGVNKTTGKINKIYGDNVSTFDDLIQWELVKLIKATPAGGGRPRRGMPCDGGGDNPPDSP